MPRTEGTVRLAASFFRKELDVYGDWISAFAREMLQNSVDAGASRIDVHIDEATDRVVVTDDGCGMTAETMTDVFFAVGETTKDTGDTVGGFGRARIILCFAQRGYTIRSGNAVATGTGDTYQIDTRPDVRPGDPDWVDGCTFEVDLIDDAASRMGYAFRSELYDCSLACTVSIDGHAAVMRQLPSRARRILRDDDGRPWAKVYVEQGRIGKVLVRARGLRMFSHYITGDDDVIVELVPARSREVLAASRDTLRGAFRAQLDEFVALMASNTRAALRPDDPPLRRRVGSGRFLSTRRTPIVDAATADDDPVDGQPQQMSLDEQPSPQEQLAESNARTAKLEARSAAADVVSSQLEVVDDEQVHDLLPFDTFLLAERNDAATRALVRDWSPEHWDDTTGSRRRALLETWTAAVSYCMGQLLQLCPRVESVDWTPGWVFDAGVEAVCQPREDAYVLALRPVDTDGVTAYRITDAADRRRLLALAAHEVCHVVVSGHDESFAGVLTDLQAIVVQADADRSMRAKAY